MINVIQEHEKEYTVSCDVTYVAKVSSRSVVEKFIE